MNVQEIAYKLESYKNDFYESKKEQLNNVTDTGVYPYIYTKIIDEIKNVKIFILFSFISMFFLSLAALLSISNKMLGEVSTLPLLFISLLSIGFSFGLSIYLDNIENAMAACGGLIGLNVDYCMISKGFMDFKLDDKFSSGRFNMYSCCERKVILDYAHNIEGYKAIISSLKKLKGKRNLIGVIGIPGDRKNDIGHAIGEICAKNFDKIVIKEDIDKRGRKNGEIAELLKSSIVQFNKNANLAICLDEVEALKHAIKISDKDDIIVVFYEKLSSNCCCKAGVPYFKS